MLASVRKHEIPKLRFFVVEIVLIWTGLAIALAVTETLLLSKLGVRYLPLALLLTSSFTLLGSLSYAALLSVSCNYRLLAGTLMATSLTLLAAFAGLQGGIEWLSLPLFAFYGASFCVLGTEVFGLAGECIDTYSSKRLFPLLSVGATCGELLGGLSVAVGARFIDPSGWLLVWGGANLLALLWLRLHRAPLASWRPAGGPVRRSQQRNGAVLRYIRGSAMARALTLLLVGMVLCQGTSQYLFSQVFARNFPRSQDLATFLGFLVASTNLAELFVGTLITPRLVAVMGVARANWLHPLLMLGGLLLLTSRFTLVPAVVLWVCRRTFQDCLATPVRNLLYNAIPVRVRGYVRAFLDGMVLAGAQASVAILLLLLQSWLKPERICTIGVGLACIYVAGALWAGKNYLATLVGELQGEGLRLQRDNLAQDLTHLPQQSGWPLSRLQAALNDPEHSLEALNQLAQHPDPLALHILGEALGSGQRALRLGAARRLGKAGQAGVRAAQGYLYSDQASTVEAALEALGTSSTPWGKSLLQAEFGARVKRAGLAWLAAQKFADNSHLPRRFLAEALHQEATRHQRLAFVALRWLEGEELVDTVRLAVAAHGGRSANALEVLSNLGDRSVAQQFVTLLEPNSPEDRQRLLQESLHLPAGLDEVLKWALHSADPWVRWAALMVHSSASPVALRKMEHLLALRACAPFSALELDRLEPLRASLLEERFASPTLLWSRGQTLRRGFVLLQGCLSQGLHHFYGGVELIGNLPARSDLSSQGPLRLLSVRQEVLHKSIAQQPELGIGCFGWLSGELRACERVVQGQP
ncbi:hypothetical protein IV102_08480 [bacterium]|nr:hypothetical protein [bacterium]